MADRISAQARSENMRRICSRDTKPELRVRQLVFGLGYRYRLHSKTLPGHPDLVFPSRRKVLFVHGCFWHQHDCKSSHIPKSNRTYWIPKLNRNRARDRKNLQMLQAMGWKALTIWECEIGDAAVIKKRVKSFLGARKMTG